VHKCTLYYITVTLRYADFGGFFLLHRCNLTKRGFELHGFFLEPKTAHLEALLYSSWQK
jgi:hypothetical protein